MKNKFSMNYVCMNSGMGIVISPYLLRVLLVNFIYIVFFFLKKKKGWVPCGVSATCPDKFDSGYRGAFHIWIWKRILKKKKYSLLWLPTNVRPKLWLFGPFVEWNYLDFERGHPLRFYGPSLRNIFFPLNFEGIDYFKLVYMPMKINFYFGIILQIYSSY
jgi:hypothetical protein